MPGHDDDEIAWSRATKVSVGVLADAPAITENPRSQLNCSDAAHGPRAALRTSPPWPSPIGSDAYHGLAGDVVKTIEPHTEADPAGLMVQFIVAVGAAIGRGPHFRVEASRHGCNLNAAGVGETAKARKGTSWDNIRPIIEIADPTMHDRVQSGLSSGEGLIHAVRDPVTQLQPVKEGRTVVGHEQVDASKNPSV